MKQLPLPFDTYIESTWWHDSNIWKSRRLVSHTSRPCEEAALDNIYSDSKIVNSVSILPSLNGLERRIYTLELRSLKELPKWYTSSDRRMWIAKQSHMSIHQITSVLDHVTHIMRDIERYQRVQTNQAWKDAAKQVLCELSTEYERQKRVGA